MFDVSNLIEEFKLVIVVMFLDLYVYFFLIKLIFGKVLDICLLVSKCSFFY